LAEKNTLFPALNSKGEIKMQFLKSQKIGNELIFGFSVSWENYKALAETTEAIFPGS
jgi:hypothetical protein